MTSVRDRERESLGERLLQIVVKRAQCTETPFYRCLSTLANLHRTRGMRLKKDLIVDEYAYLSVGKSKNKIFVFT